MIFHNDYFMEFIKYLLIGLNLSLVSVPAKTVSPLDFLSTNL